MTRGGHIPGAANVFWMQNVVSKENPVLRPAAELRRLYEEAGALPGRTIVTYCRTGGQRRVILRVEQRQRDSGRLGQPTKVTQRMKLTGATPGTCELKNPALEFGSYLPCSCRAFFPLQR